MLADVPSSLRFDILKALIQNNECSSMVCPPSVAREVTATVIVLELHLIEFIHN